MRIEWIEITNWVRFRGTHRLELKRGVYAVVARHVDDPTRSNWLGKSSFLRAIRFALDGEKPESCRFEDDWITRGESVGAVRIGFDTGLIVERKRERGSSTQLTTTWFDGAEQKVARQERAQEIINAATGLDDYGSFSFFDQKKMSQLIESKPSELHSIAEEWFDLAKLVEAEELLKGELKALLGKRAGLVNRVEMLRQMNREALNALGGSVEVANEKVEKLKAEIKERRNETQRIDDELNEHADWIIRAENAAAYVELRDKAAELKKQLKEMNPKGLVEAVELMRVIVAEADANVKAAAVETADRARLAAGKFDGECPVTCEACPVAKDVRRIARNNVQLVEQAEVQERTAREHARIERSKLAEAERKLNQARRLKNEFDALKERAQLLRDDYEEIERVGEPDEDLAELRERVRQAWEDVARAQSAVEQVEHEVERVKQREEEVVTQSALLADLDAQIATCQAAIHIFGRRGAQRLIAHTALEQIEQMANAVLAEAGVDLSLEVSWSRDGKGLATHCDACGHPFDRSQRVRVCGTCGAERGPKQVEELSIEPSNRSGAADDLTGIAFKLASAAWRRRARGIALSVAFLDEPLAYVDEANKKAIALHLMNMLSSRYGFEQSFVTAHDGAILDTLPERIEIEANEEGSRLVD